MTKFQVFETDKFKTFGFRKLEFVSDFDIRISDFFQPTQYYHGRLGGKK